MERKSLIGFEMAKKENESVIASIAGSITQKDHRTLVIWATDCAEHVLPYFENRYPDDERPRTAINAGRAWVLGEMEVAEVREAAFATHAAARDANDEKAIAAARAAGHAAATVHVRDHAIHAGAYGLKAVGPNAIKEQKWQFQHLLDLEGSRESLHS